MSECKICDKEKSIVSVTGMQIPVGEKCYTKLITKDVVWDSETKLKKIEEMLKIG
ncbi:MAG: hypothetical protein OK474_04565 [Thaumarchaeota archaeon]|jgi:hypothetical protein|nr:hypothetical protein [Nitrososphaerota archaeon]